MNYLKNFVMNNAYKYIEFRGLILILNNAKIPTHRAGIPTANTTSMTQGIFLKATVKIPGRQRG